MFMARSMRDATQETTSRSSPWTARCVRDLLAEGSPPRSAIFHAFTVAECGGSLEATLFSWVWAFQMQSGRALRGAGHVAQMLSQALLRIRTHSPIFFLLCLRTWCAAWTMPRTCQQGVFPCPWACAPVAIDSLMRMRRCEHFGAAVVGLPLARKHLARIGLGEVALLRPEACQPHCI